MQKLITEYNMIYNNSCLNINLDVPNNQKMLIKVNKTLLGE